MVKEVEYKIKFQKRQIYQTNKKKLLTKLRLEKDARDLVYSSADLRENWLKLIRLTDDDEIDDEENGEGRNKHQSGLFRTHTTLYDNDKKVEKSQ